MWIEGLPSSVRGRVWFLAFGNRSAITRDLFEIMAQRGTILKTLLKKQSAAEQLIIEETGSLPDQLDKEQHITLIKIRKKLKLLLTNTREKSILIIDTDVPRTFASISAL